MKSRLWLKIVASSSVILFIAGVLGYISLSELKHTAKSIVDDTLPGLSYAGAANAYVADAARTLMLVVSDDPQRRKENRDEINSLSQRTTTYLAAYSKQIYSDEDRTNFQALMAERKVYIKVREQTIELALAGKKNEALALYENTLVPAHKRVKAAADKLFEYNMREGQERGRKIMQMCTVTQIAVAVVSVIIFLTGFFIGLFK
jgi:methyl-accepting chemotaxis protein